MSSSKMRQATQKKLSKKQNTPVWLMILVGAVAITVLFVPADVFHSKTPIAQQSVTPTNSDGTPTKGEPLPERVGTAAAANPFTITDLSVDRTTNWNSLSDSEKAALYQNFGSQLLDKGRFADAIAQYRKAVQLNPQDEDTHYNLALALSKGGDVEGAKAEYLESLKLYPDYPEAHNNLGNLLLAEGKLDDAVTHFKAALETTPEDPSIHNNLGHALARQKKLEEAIPAFREALRLKPDYAEARYNLGMAYLGQNQTAQAASEFTEILRTQPDFGPALQGLARVRTLEKK